MSRQAAVESEKYYRLRVLDFEAEVQKKIEDIKDLEKDVLSVGQKRTIWLKYLCSLDNVENSIFENKIAVVKNRAETLSSRLMTDILRLEGFYESQTLNYLIEVTKPTENGETLEERKRVVAALNRQSAEDLKEAVLYSIDYRKELGEQAVLLAAEINRIKVECVSHYKLVIQNIHDKLVAFLEDVKERKALKAKEHKKVTGDYLVLRHNAKVARELVVKSQKDAISGRIDLQSGIDKIIEDAQHQREVMERATAAELRLLTEDVRLDVMKKEKELDEITNRVEALRKKTSGEYKHLKSELKSYKSKYLELQQKRKLDITCWNNNPC
jgi:hypothetical protein